ncbi:MAG: hypothetical protein HQK98_07140 [Nitrospirae bacterium]|nr:hypothetical protein [Nitrospirota bacterium]
MRMRLVVSMVVMLTSVIWFGSIGAAADFVVDDFSGAKQDGSNINSNSRTWSAYGGLGIKLSDRSLVASGKLDVWGGFVAEPGPNGQNGAPIPVTGKSIITVVCKGVVPKIKLELYDNNRTPYELWFAPQSGKATLNLPLPKAIVAGGVISKILFGISPGDINFTVYSITIK